MFSKPLRDGFELRLLEERHAEEMFAVVDRERMHLRTWLAWVDATRTPDDSLAFIRSSLEQFAGNRGFAAGIWKGPLFAGTVGTHTIDWLNRKVEIGYWLAREFEGRGLVTDACRAMVTHLFDALDLHRVEIRCAVANAKSAAVPKRLGFAQEATLREAHFVNGECHDLMIFGMLQRDWKRGA
ncbi:MAG: GNAT family protein [Bryobacteraceae bacterium]